MSRRSDIASAIVSRLQALGVFTTVERWRDTSSEPFGPGEVPALNVKDGNAAITHEVSLDEHALEVKLDVVTTPGVSAALVEDLLGSIAASIMSDEYWGGLADGTNIESHEIDTTSDAADTMVAGQLKIIVNYTTDKGQL